MTGLLQQWADFLPQYWPGLLVTIELTIIALAVGLPAGAFLAILSSSPSRLVRWPVIALVEIGRGIPALVVLYLVYRGLPQFGLTLSSFISASAGLAFSTAAYSAEIIRSGINSIPEGQREAARALALSNANEFRLVVLPQALRKVIPPLIGQSVLLFQGTSLAYAISTPELLSKAYNIASISYQFTAALTLAGVIYAVISLAATALAGSRARRPL